jgi:hypothetical protein
MKNPAKCRVFVDVVRITYKQRPHGESSSRSLKFSMLATMIVVFCFISVLYMMIGEKSRLFGSIASRIFASGDSFTVTVRTVSDSNPVSGHESYHFVFTGFVPAVTFDSVLHNVSLTYIYNAIAPKRVYTGLVTLPTKSVSSQNPICMLFLTDCKFSTLCMTLALINTQRQGSNTCDSSSTKLS